MSKKRVSAKQRLELVIDALSKLNNSKFTSSGTDLNDLLAFVDAVEFAATGKIVPRGDGEV